MKISSIEKSLPHINEMDFVENSGRTIKSMGIRKVSIYFQIIHEKINLLFGFYFSVNKAAGFVYLLSSIRIIHSTFWCEKNRTFPLFNWWMFLVTECLCIFNSHSIIEGEKKNSQNIERPNIPCRFPFAYLLARLTIFFLFIYSIVQNSQWKTKCVSTRRTHNGRKKWEKEMTMCVASPSLICNGNEWSIWIEIAKKSSRILFSTMRQSPTCIVWVLTRVGQTHYKFSTKYSRDYTMRFVFN